MTCRERILSNDYADIITDFRISEELDYEQAPDYCSHKLTEELSIYYVNRNSLPNASAAVQGYEFLPKCYGLLSEKEIDMHIEIAQTAQTYNLLALNSAGILSVQGEPLNLTGKRVTIGFIDTGIRYQNEVFLNQIGQSRIMAIWDQTIQSGNLPEGFEFGSEFTNEQIQEALNSENPLSIVPSTDTNGHGTAMASVAAGSRYQGNGSFIGAAPDCDIVVVKLKEAKPYLRDYYLIPQEAVCYQENDIMLAIEYLQKFAVTLYRPLIICLGVGTSLGDHAGNSILSRYMEKIMDYKSRVFVTAGGNEGNSAHHFYGEITRTQNFRNVELRVADNVQGFIMDFWGEAPFLFTVTIRSPGGESVEWVNPRIQRPQEFAFVFDKTRFTIEYFIVEQASGAQLIRFRFVSPTQGIWTIRVNSANDITRGSFHIWLPITQFLSNDTYFLEPNPEVTLTEPAYTRRAVAITSYNDVNNSLYGNAGRGFSRDGYPKPDIAAPGVDVSTILGNRTGSSVAAAITAGAAAQLMQWAVVERNNIFADSQTVRNYMIRGAIRENTLSYPNAEWGYGRLNIQGVFEFLAGI